MSRFKISHALISWAVLVLSVISAVSDAHGAYQNVGYVSNNQNQDQNKLSGAMKQISNGVSTAAVWTVKAPYQVGKYLVTEIFRPFVPIRNKLVDWFGVEVESESP